MIKSLLLSFCMVFSVSLSFSQNPVAENGPLQVIGHQLCNKNGKPLQLRGMSMFGLMHMPECVTWQSFKLLKEEWKANVIRVPVYMANYSNQNNYNQNPEWNNALIDSTIKWSERLGIYCIIDWHNDRYGSPNDSNHKKADSFFKLMSAKYAGKKNVIYELINEPYGETITWDTIAAYANRIMPIIRKNDPKAIILVGCPVWDQKLESIDTKKLNDTKNVMYTFHFYANSHQSLYPMFASQIHRIPVFVSEWGTCESSGMGNLDLNTSSRFLNTMRQHVLDKDTVTISWCNFSYGDKAESTSALKPHSCADGIWDNTTPGGDFIKYWIKYNAAPENSSKVKYTLVPDGLKLPAICSTPDGMAIAPDGSLLLTCPNYADQSVKACILKIDKNFKASLFYEFPAYKPTGVVCPMGIDLDRNGDIYICDNQPWKGTPEGQFKGRILKLKVVDGKVTKLIEVATGMEHPNGVKIKGDYAYVTQSMLSKVKDPSQLLTSAVYRFPINAANIQVANELTDANLLVSFKTYNKFCQYGLDGLVFDSKGNLIVGNFGDGTLHKIIFDTNQKVSKVELLAKTDFNYNLDPKSSGFITEAVKTKMRTTDGIAVDSGDNIYVADFSNNAISKVSPSGEIEVIAQYEDNDGSNGKLNQPGEPVLWNGKLVVVNFDMVTGPDKVNTKHDSGSTLSLFTLTK
jgi:sugar lactone lactonase YvrE